MNKRKIDKFKYFIGALLVITLMQFSLNSSTLIASSSTSTKKCTHTVYKNINNSKYHYTYCKICGKAKSRKVHSVSKIVNNGSTSTHLTYCSCGKYMGTESHGYVSYSRYNTTYHYATCSCGYTGLKSHNVQAKELKNGESVNGATYSGTENLDTYHKMVCRNCNTVTGVEAHNWTGGDTSAHTCSGCSYVHSKKNDATHGLHYFNLNKIRSAGDITTCVVCKAMLKLEYTSDNILSTLPKKEEYTMVGNPNPMLEKSITTDQKIKANFMPINENGEIIPLDDLMLRVRSYKHGNYYAHYSKLIGGTSSLLSDKIKYLEDSGMIEYITNELNNLNSNNEEVTNQVLSNINNKIKNDPNLGFIDTYALTTVISQLGDFAVESIRSPLIEWFTKDLAIKYTWLGGGTTTLRHDFKGNMNDSSSRIYTVYFSELPTGRYEILMSPLLTYGINFNLFSYSAGGFGTMLFSTLFNIGNPGVSSPSNIKAYIGVAYRDTNGNIIRNKKGGIATPIDSIISNIVYSGTSAKSVTKNITAEMNWTQAARL